MDPRDPLTASILILDDEDANVVLLHRLLRHHGYENCTSLSDPRAFWATFDAVRPDIVLLDLHMPHIDGLQILAELAAVSTTRDFLPVLMLTADITPASRQRALELGARDFVTKPFDASEVLLRVQNLLHARALTLRLHEHNELLEERVRERTAELEAAQVETVDRLALAAEFRDDDTGSHIRSVGRLAGRIASALGLAPAFIETIEIAAPLHDIGKIGIPDAILLKPGKLDADEMQTIRTHSEMGARILRGAQAPLLVMAQSIALSHHERWDGTGYPHGLAREAIPLEGRITAVADVFDALTRQRPYKRAWPVDDAIEEIARSAGSHFDPDIVAAFLTFAGSAAADAGLNHHGIDALART